MDKPQLTRSRRLPILHGGDYNPDQWLDRPDILKKDILLMKEAHVNCMSVGIFSWARLEPEEGVYTFGWLEEIIDRLWENGVYTILATPSGGKPVWMAKKYPEICRVNPQGMREWPGNRQNHCYTSPVFREKVGQINARLAQRFAAHPGVILWHLSNEYSGECYCPLCRQAFREWLQTRYESLESLNHAWWTDFWSHRYTAWEQIEPPVPHGETCTNGLWLDWKRFVTHQTVAFAKWERETVTSVSPSLPVTANMMGDPFRELNYAEFREVVDIVSWDSYPLWGSPDGDETATAHRAAFCHDQMRALRRAPFLLMESTPSVTNWHPVSRLKRPGIHMLSSMQAVAHGANSVQYFQWRKSRGATEKFHGAVVSHDGRSDTRVFRDVADLGRRLEGLGSLTACCQKPEVAILYDWENRWALEGTAGPRNAGLDYVETVMAHHRAFWRYGIDTDVVDMSDDLTGYRLIVAPLLYMLREGIAGKLRNFVRQGGTLVATYWSGIVDEHDLCYLGGIPGAGLDELLGLRSEEIDALYDGEQNRMVMTGGDLPRDGYAVSCLCDLVWCTTAQVLAVYGEDFYKGRPALTVNHYGDGRAYYLAARAEDAFYDDFYHHLAGKLGLRRSLDADLPAGVVATQRRGDHHFIFVQNYTPRPQSVAIDTALWDAETGRSIESPHTLAPYEVAVWTTGIDRPRD